MLFYFVFFFSVKVGGMRVVQHKPPSHKEAASADLEDCTGLTVIIYVQFNSSSSNKRDEPFSVKKNNKRNNLFMYFSFFFFQQPPNINTELVSGAPVKGNADFTVQATQVAHAPKAPNNIASNKNQVHHINQPRK